MAHTAVIILLQDSDLVSPHRTQRPDNGDLVRMGSVNGGVRMMGGGFGGCIGIKETFYICQATEGASEC